MKLKGVQIGRNVKLFGKPIIKMHPLSQIIIEDNVGINNNSFRSSSTSLYGPCRFVTHFPTSLIVIKKDTGLNGTSIIARSKKIILGERVKIAPNVSIFDSPFHYLWPVNKRKKYNTSELDQDVIIGNDVWICTGSLSLPGANIGVNGYPYNGGGSYWNNSNGNYQSDWYQQQMQSQVAAQQQNQASYMRSQGNAQAAAIANQALYQEFQSSMSN